MFGRKKAESPKNDIQVVKNAVMKADAQAELKQQIAQQTPTQKTPFYLTEEKREEISKKIVTPSGSVIETGEKEVILKMNRIMDISFDDIIDIVVHCKDLPVGDKFYQLLLNRMK